MKPVGYIRRSRVDTRSPGAMSHQQQREAIERLAANHNDTDLTWIEDWGKSGRAEKQHLRVGFAHLEAMVEGGEASAVYAYSASRLARSLEALARLAKIAGDHGVPIRCADGYSPDVSTSTGRMVLGILGSVYAWQAEWTQERANETTTIRRARGDFLGPAPYGFRVEGGRLVEDDSEDPSQVVDAFRRTGSYLGAARLLTEQGIPPRGAKGGTRWQASTVKGILKRVAPSIVPRSIRVGRPPSRDFLLTGLLKCPYDGAMLTGRTEKRGTVAYSCRRREDPAHPYPRSIAEAQVLPWVKAEALRLVLRSGRLILGGANEARREELVARRRGIGDALALGAYTKDEASAKLAAVLAELDEIGLDEQSSPYAESPIRWPDEPLPSPFAVQIIAKDVNERLRGLWRHVELGPDLRPVAASWYLPDWRRP